MKIIGDLVIFRSAEPFYSREKSGRKSNTERIVSDEEIKWITEHSPKVTDIRIEYFESSDEYFDRELTDISLISDLLGYNLVVFSWKHEGVIEVLK